MPRRWTKTEEKEKRIQLRDLYIKQNKTIGEISGILGLKESSVYDRLIRLNIPAMRWKKYGFNNINRHIQIPKTLTDEMAEFIGILLGDGHLTPTQVTVTLGTKEHGYVEYVMQLIFKLFGIIPKKVKTLRGDSVVYFGSTPVVRWLLAMGLAYNKVKVQVGIPEWCSARKNFMKCLVRGLFDTDGSVYRLKSGAIQISFTNRSHPLLHGVRIILKQLGFSPSQISSYRIYLTRKTDVLRYAAEIGFKNPKHQIRLNSFMESTGGSYSGNYTAL